MRPRSLLLVLFIVLSAAETTSAARVPSYDFNGTLVAPRLGEEEEGAAPSLMLLTGEFTADGTTTGLFTAAGTVGAQILNIDHLEALKTGGKVPDRSDVRGLLGLERQTFDNVSVTIGDNSSLAYFGGDENGNVFNQTYASASAFALVVPVDPPADLGGLGIETTQTSLAVIGPAALSVELEEPNNAFLFFMQDGMSLTVWQGGRPVANFTDKDWMYSISGQPRLSLEADSLLIPVAGTVSARLRPGDGAVADARLDLGRIADAYARSLPNATGDAPLLDEAISQQVREASGIFNGVLFGNPTGNASVDNGAEQQLGDLTLYRFDQLEISPGETRGELTYAGSGEFVLAGNHLYSSKAAAGPSNLPFPILAIFLWMLAATAIVLSFVLKPFVPPNPANASRPVRLSALIFHLVMIPIAFVLWDIETHAFLGASILSLLGGSGGEGVAFAAVAGVQGLSFLLAWTFFGLPVRFLTNSGLKLMQLKRARGVGKGLSYISAWGLGAAYYALLLNPFIGLLVGAFGGFQ